MKIILYGLGKGLEYIESNLKCQHEIVGYSDSYATISVFKGKPFYRPKEISMVDADYVVIAIRDRKIAYKVYQMLIGDLYGLQKEKVIPFYVYAKGEYWDYCLAHSDVENMEGLIMGTSYARRGIMPEYLSASFVNIAVPSSDLYATMETFRACVNKYGTKMKKLKYVVIDMFDYNYFNFDVSLCKIFFSHLGYGGIIKRHNFDKNTYYSNEFEEELLQQLGIKVGDAEIINELFNENYGVDYEVGPYDRYQCINDNEPLPIGHFFARIVTNPDEEVIKYNVQHFESLLWEIFKINPNMQVVLMLFPKYITLENAKGSLMNDWKDEFERIVGKYLDDSVHLFDYKFREDIVNNRRLWYDIEHLNTIGAKCMTSIIEDDFKKKIYRK